MHILKTFLASFLAMFLGLAAAQPYPGKPVTLVINSEPGGAQDRIAQALKEDLAAQLGQAVVLDYRPGAGGINALAAFKRARPDGYTLLLTGSGPVTIAPLLYQVPYDPARDFDYVHRLLDLPGVIAIRAALPAETLQEFVAMARKSPGKYTFASSGIASPSHLLGERLKLLAGIDLLHVPFKGPPQAVNSMLAGDVDLFMASAPLVLPHAATGKLRLVAVTGTKRLKIAPEVPTLAEAGLGELTLPSWFGILAPKGIPADVLQTVSKAVDASLGSPKVREALDKLGAEIVSMPGPEFARYQEATTQTWRQVIRQAGIKAE